MKANNTVAQAITSTFFMRLALIVCFKPQKEKEGRDTREKVNSPPFNRFLLSDLAPDEMASAHKDDPTLSEEERLAPLQSKVPTCKKPNKDVRKHF
jgi:hypothetical protein